MGGAAGGKLAAHVTQAGGFGFIGGGYFTPDQITKEFDQVREILGVNDSSRVEVGMGFLAWKLTELDGGIATSSLDDVNSRPKAYACIDIALRCRPRAIWLAFGADRELVQWAQAIKKREREIHGATDTTEGIEPWVLFMGVGSVQEAEAAIEADADVIVAQGRSRELYFCSQCILPSRTHRSSSIPGIEAGGHGSSTSPPLSNLLPSIVDLLKTRNPSSNRPTKPCVIGAGGLSSGAHLLSTLSLQQGQCMEPVSSSHLKARTPRNVRTCYSRLRREIRPEAWLSMKLGKPSLGLMGLTVVDSRT
jgi:nitronate monooxygenase